MTGNSLSTICLSPRFLIIEVCNHQNRRYRLDQSRQIQAFQYFINKLELTKTRSFQHHEAYWTNAGNITWSSSYASHRLKFELQFKFPQGRVLFDFTESYATCFKLFAILLWLQSLQLWNGKNANDVKRRERGGEGEGETGREKVRYQYIERKRWRETEIEKERKQKREKETEREREKEN